MNEEKFEDYKLILLMRLFRIYANTYHKFSIRIRCDNSGAIESSQFGEIEPLFLFNCLDEAIEYLLNQLEQRNTNESNY